MQAAIDNMVSAVHQLQKEAEKAHNQSDNKKAYELSQAALDVQIAISNLKSIK